MTAAEDTPRRQIDAARGIDRKSALHSWAAHCYYTLNRDISDIFGGEGDATPMRFLSTENKGFSSHHHRNCQVALDGLPFIAAHSLRISEFRRILTGATAALTGARVLDLGTSEGASNCSSSLPGQKDRISPILAE